MNKKIFSLILILLCIGVQTTSAQIVQLKPPTLQETLEKNEELARQQALEIIPEKPTEKIIDFTYRKVYTGNAINIYRANEAMLWMQEINLSKGAKVDSAIEVVSYNSETGEPQYQKKTITQTLSSLITKPTSLVNGQFFNPSKQPSELSFGLKQ